MSHSFDEYKIDPFLATEDIRKTYSTVDPYAFHGGRRPVGFGLPNWHTLIARLLGKRFRSSFHGRA